MSGVNKAIIVGNLGRDPEIRYTANGQAVANFSVATSESWKDKQSGEDVERTEWHRIVVWGKLAELCSQYLAKGRSAYIEGQLQTREWEDKDGNKRQTTEIKAHTVQFLGGKGEPRREPQGVANARDILGPQDANTGARSFGEGGPGGFDDTPF